MLPTETSRDVGMVDGASDATGSSMEKQTGGNVQEQVYSVTVQLTIWSTVTVFKTHFRYTFATPTSGNILMQLGSVYQSALLTSIATFSAISRLLMHIRFYFPMQSVTKYSNLQIK